MPKVGLSRPYAALYSNNGVGGVTYKEGVRAGRAVEYSLTVESGSDNDFVCDNGVGESAGGTFTSGELSVTVAELEQRISKFLLGLKEKKITVGDEEVMALIYDDTMKNPEMGYGIIVKNIIHGVTKWRAVVLTKVKFNIPEDAATTQGESIEWQTDTATAKVMRDDTESHAWRIDATFDTEAKADAFICHILNIKSPGLDELTVTSTAGATVGTTAVTVTPMLTDGRSYRYKTGADLAIPALYEDLSSWTAWDGTSDITAATGEKIAIAEVDSAGLAMAAGLASVTAKEV